MLTQLHLHVAKADKTYTFSTRRTGLVIDVTFTDEDTIGRLRGWVMLDDYSQSDHNYVSYQL
jgi:hypothetical protein